MNKIFFFLVLFLLLPVNLFAESKSAGPKILVNETTKDFGIVSRGDVLKHEFTITNEGDQPLIIKEINPACGCTAAVVNDPVIQAGKETQLRVTFETESFEGIKSKPIRIYTNDPRQSSIVFSVKANILPNIQVTPSRLDLGDISRNSKISQKLELSSRLSSFEITEVISKSEYLNTSFVKLTDKSYSVNISSIANLPLGKNRARIIIKTNDPKQQIINYQLTFFSFGDLSFSPKSLNFGALSEKNSNPSLFSRSIRVQNFSSDTKTTINNVISSTKSAYAVLKEDSLGQFIEISLNSKSRGVIRGLVTANTSSLIEDEKTIEFQFFAIIED